mgnify:CR=1 FL=1
MASIKLNSATVEQPDNKPIIDSCKKLGIPFGCQDGSCGTCMIMVEEGMENLSAFNAKEKELGIEPPQRLACQCVLKKGMVKVKGLGF